MKYTQRHLGLSSLYPTVRELTMAMYQAVYDYSSSAAGMLSFRSGDKFTVRNRTNDDWWTVENAKGDMGLVPVSYLDPLVVRQ